MGTKQTPNKWTDLEIQILKKHYYELGPHNLSKIFYNHPRCSIVAKARMFGLEYKNKGVQWEKEEIEILKKYYPKEGTKISSRLPNRTRLQIKEQAGRLGIKNERIQEPWAKEEDVIVYEFYLAERSHKTDKATALLEILKNKGFTTHSLKSVRMRLANFEYLVDGTGLSNAAIQSKTIHKKHNEVVKPQRRF